MGITKEEILKQKETRLGMEKYNNDGELMKIIDYVNSKHITVQFQDEYKTQKNTIWRYFEEGTIRNPRKLINRIGEKNYNSQNDLMKIVEYKKSNNITVEFQDKYRAQIKTRYSHFKNGTIINPYHASVCGIGMPGIKYGSVRNGKVTKEYPTWSYMIEICSCETSKNAICCEEWLLFDNFYEWLHSQENFDKWLNGEYWTLDKDILIKGNKIYSPETCCLVPRMVNSLFKKQENKKTRLPIGVQFEANRQRYIANCSNSVNGKDYNMYLGSFNNSEDAFKCYKEYKENLIKRVARIEFNKGNITKRCFESMLKYEVEITD